MNEENKKKKTKKDESVKTEINMTIKNEDKKKENKSQKESKEISKVIKELIPYIIIIIIVFLIKKYLFVPIKVNGESMYSTLEDGDIMILDKVNYKEHDIKRFDIVVIDAENEYLIKRVVGLPGELIEYKDNKLYINEQLVEENFSHEVTEDFVTRVPKDRYFVMGDNRINSVDSRVLGSFQKKNIIGNADFVIFPFSRFGEKK